MMKKFIKKFVYLFVIALIVFYTKKFILFYFDLDIYNVFLDFFLYSLSGAIIWSVSDIILNMSMPLGGNENIGANSPASSSSGEPMDISSGGSPSINIPNTNSPNNSVGNLSLESDDTDWSGGEPASPNALNDFINNTLNQVASNDPVHRVQDPTGVANFGYMGGGGLGSSDSESNHSDDSGLGDGTVTTIQPFATNLANYIAAYKTNPNATYSTHGFPLMDERSLVWYAGYLNTNFPSHYGADRLNPTSSRILNALRESR
jgi:hypothetical protein